MNALFPAFLIIVSASVVDAATDVTTINCDFVTTCNHDGVCAAATERRVTFTVEPLKVEQHGEGEYIIQYDQISAQMWWAPFPGSMTWVEGTSDAQTLTGLGQSMMMWHQLRIGGVPTSVVHFLKCEDEA